MSSGPVSKNELHILALFLQTIKLGRFFKMHHDPCVEFVVFGAGEAYYTRAELHLPVDARSKTENETPAIVKEKS
jgi:hypothetical protein